MNEQARTIGVVRGAPGALIQEMLGEMVERWRPSARIAGVVAESHGLADRACSAGYLRSIASGERFPFFQDHGPGSLICHIEGGGALTAAEAVERDIAAGCDLVVLNKFGKLEAGGEGLRQAFDAALEAGVPILTSVSPAFEDPWTTYAAPRFAYLPAEPAEIEAWWRAVRHRRQ